MEVGDELIYLYSSSEADRELPEELCGRVDGLPHVEKAVMIREV